MKVSIRCLKACRRLKHDTPQRGLQPRNAARGGWQEAGREEGSEGEEEAHEPVRERRCICILAFAALELALEQALEAGF